MARHTKFIAQGKYVKIVVPSRFSYRSRNVVTALIKPNLFSLLTPSLYHSLIYTLNGVSRNEGIECRPPICQTQRGERESAGSKVVQTPAPS